MRDEIRALKLSRRSPFSGECLFLVATIIQHESGSMNPDAWEFMADQITYDAAAMGCGNVTTWRWAIKSRPRPSTGVLVAAGHWPRTYPKCQFVGMPPDIAVWEAAGFEISVDYTFQHGRFTIVGANCKNRTSVLLTSSKRGQIMEPPDY